MPDSKYFDVVFYVCPSLQHASADLITFSLQAAGKRIVRVVTD